jgi:hypothetical protein
MIPLAFLLLAIALFGGWNSASRLLDALATGRITDQRRVITRAEQPVRFARYFLSNAVILAASIAMMLYALTMLL